MKLYICALFAVGCLASFNGVDAASVSISQPAVQCLSKVIVVTVQLNTACQQQNIPQIKLCSKSLLSLFLQLQRLIPSVGSISRYTNCISLIKQCQASANAGQVNNIGPIIIQLLGDFSQGTGSGAPGSGGTIGLIPQVLGELLGGFGTGLTGIVPDLLTLLLGNGATVTNSNSGQAVGLINQLLFALLSGGGGTGGPVDGILNNLFTLLLGGNGKVGLVPGLLNQLLGGGSTGGTTGGSSINSKIVVQVIVAIIQFGSSCQQKNFDQFSQSLNLLASLLSQLSSIQSCSKCAQQALACSLYVKQLLALGQSASVFTAAPTYQLVSTGSGGVTGLLPQLLNSLLGGVGVSASGTGLLNNLIVKLLGNGTSVNLAAVPQSGGLLNNLVALLLGGQTNTGQTQGLVNQVVKALLG